MHDAGVFEVDIIVDREPVLLMVSLFYSLYTVHLTFTLWL